MKIYTKGGDAGKTFLFGGKKVLKSDIIIEAVGTIDELNAFIGYLVVKLKNKKHKDFLINIQKDLYQTMSILSGANLGKNFLKEKVLIFEKEIDKVNKKLSDLNKFIIPGGTETSSLFHILRVICRRAERCIAKCYFADQLNKNLREVIIYFNRLSDLFFIFARFYNRKKEISF